jgi:hypothetical protein
MFAIIFTDKRHGVCIDQLVFRKPGYVCKFGIDVFESALLHDIAADQGVLFALKELKLGQFSPGIVMNESLDGEGPALRIVQNDPTVMQPADGAVRMQNPVTGLALFLAGNQRLFQSFACRLPIFRVNGFYDLVCSCSDFGSIVYSKKFPKGPIVEKEPSRFNIIVIDRILRKVGKVPETIKQLRTGNTLS